MKRMGSGMSAPSCFRPAKEQKDKPPIVAPSSAAGAAAECAIGQRRVANPGLENMVRVGNMVEFRGADGLWQVGTITGQNGSKVSLRPTDPGQPPLSAPAMVQGDADGRDIWVDTSWCGVLAEMGTHVIDLVDEDFKRSIAPGIRLAMQAAYAGGPLPINNYLGWKAKDEIEALVRLSNGQQSWRIGTVAKIVETGRFQVLFSDPHTHELRSYYVYSKLNEFRHVTPRISSFDSDLNTELFDHDLICCSCTAVPLYPVSPARTDTKETVFCCGTVLCSSCLESWKRQKAPDPSPPCPHCQAPFQSAQPSALAIKKIGGLKVRCPNRKLGCEHICLVGVRGANLLKHLDECMFRPVTCSDCGTEVPNQSFDTHWKTQCAKRPVECSHCQEIIAAEVLAQHLAGKSNPALKCAGQIFCPNACTSASAPAAVVLKPQPRKGSLPLASGPNIVLRPWQTVARKAASSEGKAPIKSAAQGAGAAAGPAAAAAPSAPLLTVINRSSVREHLIVCPLSETTCRVCSAKVLNCEIGEHVAGDALQHYRLFCDLLDQQQQQRFSAVPAAPKLSPRHLAPVPPPLPPIDYSPLMPIIPPLPVFDAT